MDISPEEVVQQFAQHHTQWLIHWSSIIKVNNFNMNIINMQILLQGLDVPPLTNPEFPSVNTEQH